MISIEPQQWKLSVGVGQARYAMNKGSFRTRDRVRWMRTLSLEEAGADEWLFSGGEYRVRVLIKRQAFGAVLHFEAPKEINRFSLAFPASPSEHLYGCGEQFTTLDLKGKTAVIWVSEHHSVKKFALKFLRESLFGRRYGYIPPYRTHQTYHAQPSFLSSDRYFVHADCNAYAEFSFRPAETVLSFRGVPRSVTFLWADSFPALCGKISDLLGKQPRLPKWVSEGAILASQGGMEKALRKIAALKDAGGRVSGIWCQDWSGQIVTKFGTQVYWNWQASKELYPGLAEQSRALAAQGIRFLGYINTFLKEDAPLYREALLKGYLVARPEGGPYLIQSTTFNAGIVDLTSPEAFAWYKDVVKREMLGCGLYGWMADFGEYLPTDAVVAGGSAEELHNSWPGLWARLNREAVEEAGRGQDVFFFSRAGNAETLSQTNSMWCGDQHVDWSDADGMASAVTATLSMACVGVGVAHSDIGGYTTVLHMKRDAELLMRWTEMNVFTPVLRCHEGNRPQCNVQFDDPAVIGHFAAMTRLFAGLGPYRDACLEEYDSDGVPVNRPLFFHYDEDFCYRSTRAFLMGEELICFPVVRPGMVQWEIHLPEGEWKRLLTGEPYSGGVHSVDVPLGLPAVFYRAGGRHADFFSSLQAKDYAFAPAKEAKS